VADQITKIQSANVSSLGADVVLERGIKAKIPKKIGGDLGQAIG
jgi:hypothetical protein